METKLATAKELGTKAFNNNCKRIPCLDKDFLKLLKDISVESDLSIKIIDAWLTGWDGANLKYNPNIQSLNFINGKAEIKKDRNIIAKIFDRSVFYAKNNIKSSYSAQYPFSIEIPNIGSRECSTLEECIEMIEKYTS